MATVFREYGVDFWAIGALPIGFGLEWLFGGYRWKPNSSHFIGRLVRLAEGGLRVAVARRGGGPQRERLAGLVLVVVVVGLVAGMAWLAVELLDQVGGPPTLLGRTLLIAWGLSFRRLVGQVVRASEAIDLRTARQVASEFLGLDANRADQSSIRRACVEILGDQTNRLVVGPMFWLAVGGIPGLLAYQAIATIRVLIVNGLPRGRDFGSIAIRLDDLTNFVPARLTWLLIALSAALLGEDGGSSLRSGWLERGLDPGLAGRLGRISLLAALEMPRDARPAECQVDARTVRRSVRVLQLAGLHALTFAFAYRVMVIGR